MFHVQETQIGHPWTAAKRQRAGAMGYKINKMKKHPQGKKKNKRHKQGQHQFKCSLRRIRRGSPYCCEASVRTYEKFKKARYKKTYTGAITFTLFLLVI